MVQQRSWCLCIPELDSKKDIKKISAYAGGGKQPGFFSEQQRLDQKDNELSQLTATSYVQVLTTPITIRL